MLLPAHCRISYNIHLLRSFTECKSKDCALHSLWGTPYYGAVFTGYIQQRPSAQVCTAEEESMKMLQVFDCMQIVNTNISQFRITLSFGTYSTVNKLAVLVPRGCITGLLL
jgi:hypothetical protein